MLHGGQRFPAGQADIAHVADVENSDAGAHRHVLGNNAAPDRGRVFHRHVPAVELHHLRAHLAMDGVQRSLPDLFWDGGRSSLDNGQENLGQKSFRQALLKQWLGCWYLELINLTSSREEQQIKGRRQVSGLRRNQKEKPVTGSAGLLFLRPDTCLWVTSVTFLPCLTRTKLQPCPLSQQ